MLMESGLYKGIFMTTVFLHIGLTKTGTTAIQNFLRTNDAILARHGICFPDMGYKYPGVNPNRNAHFLVSSYDTEPVAEHFTPLDEYLPSLDRLTALSKSYDKILLTDELIWRICNQHKDFLPTITHDLACRGMQLKVIVYLRRQDEFIQSRYRQRMKAGETFSFYEFLDTLHTDSYPLDFYSAVNMISDVIGRDHLIIRIYEKQQYKGEEHTLCSDFLDIFGLSVSDGFIEQKKRMNRSLQGTYLEIRRTLNALPQNIKETPVLAKSIREMQENEHGPKKSSKQTLFHFDDQKRFLEQFRESNSRLAREYLGRSDGMLFYEPLEELPYEQSGTDELLQDTLLVFGRAIQILNQKNNELKIRTEKLEKEISKNCLMNQIKKALKKLSGRK